MESAICHSAKIVAYKFLRLCSLEQIERLYNILKSEGVDVYLIHLVRDPRAMLSSGLRLELDDKDAKRHAQHMCSKLNKFLEIENEGNLYGYTKVLCLYTVTLLRLKISFLGFNSTLFSDNKYIRVRLEDLTINPVLEVEKIYKLVYICQRFTLHYIFVTEF